MLNNERFIECGDIPYEVFDNPNLLKLTILIDEFDFGNSEALEENYLIRLKQLVTLELTGIVVSKDIFINEICTLHHLEELTLLYSDISEIPSEIENLVNLKSLTLRGNQLDSLPSSFKNLSKLKELNLISNKFKEVPTFIFEMEQLQSIYIHDNPIEVKYHTVLSSLGHVYFSTITNEAEEQSYEPENEVQPFVSNQLQLFTNI